MSSNWSKYSYVCSFCDSLIETTVNDSFKPMTNITCTCNGKTTLMSVVSATIATSTQTKGNNMLDNLEASMDLGTPYNADLLVTYKVIKGYSDSEFVTDKVRNIEYELHNNRQISKVALQLQNQVSTVNNIINNAYADSDDQDTLRSIAEALGIDLIKEIAFEATMQVSGIISINILEDSDYDLESLISETLTADSLDSNIEVHDYSVDYVRENN